MSEVSEFNSLREYQEDLARRIEERKRYAEQHIGAETGLFVGLVSNGQRFLLPGNAISEVAPAARFSPFPAAKPWAVGAGNVKGIIYNVIDFSMFMNGPPTRGGKFILLNPDMLMGAAILVESLATLLDENELGTPIVIEHGQHPEWVTGCHEIKGERYLMIDPALLISNDKFSKLQTIGE